MNGKSSASKAESLMLDKLVLTNRSALEAKYGVRGFARIKAALVRMGKADAKRGVKLHIALLDQPSLTNVPAVTNVDSARQNKRAIDALFKSLGKPDYLMILGGPDVVPHQRLRNPLAGEADEEPIVPSDLPYACDQAYSLDVGKFLGPTRVVGRVPDVPEGNDVGYLVGLMDRASKAVYLKNKTYFGLSAEVWRGATRQNIRVGLGVAKPAFYCSPRLGPSWTKPYINRSIHLINCHGDSQHPGFLGEATSGHQSQAIDPSALKKRLAANAVVAAECCYGAELYAPNQYLPKGMALSYLEEGAVAFLGSSTIAYGGFTASTVSEADVICAEFLSQVTVGATTGRALLAAQQRLLRNSPSPGAFELKTLAQFMLLGDPSYRAFPAKLEAERSEKVAEHRARRKKMALVGAALQREVAPICKPMTPTISATELTAGMKMPKTVSGTMHVMQFEHERPKRSGLPGVNGAGPRAAKAAKRAGIELFVRSAPGNGAETVAVAVQEREPRSSARALSTARSSRAKSARANPDLGPKPVKNRVFVVARMVDGQVVSRQLISTR